MKKSSWIVAAVFLFWTSAGIADNWYVRPFQSGGYGDGSGNSYYNAWNGLDAVKWTAANTGIKAGDTLWICGPHGDFGSGYIGDHTSLVVGDSGNTQQGPIVIRGDCETTVAPPDAARKGSIRRTAYRHVGGWTDVGSGVYSHPHTGTLANGGLLYEDGVLLENQVYSLDDMANWPPGTWYRKDDIYNEASGNYHDPVYVKPLAANEHPNQHYYTSLVGARVVAVIGQAHITVRDLELMGATTSDGVVYLNNADYVTLQSLRVSDGYFGIRIANDSDHGELLDSTITRLSEGIGMTSPTGTSNDYWTIARNEISVIGRHPWFAGYGDKEGIGTQNTVGTVIEYNQIRNVGGVGVALYKNPNGPFKDNTIRFNRIDDVTDSLNAGTGRETGIDFHTDNTTYVADDNTGNRIYGNVISGVKAVQSAGYSGAAIFTSSGHPSSGRTFEIFNNTIYDSTACLVAEDKTAGSIGFEFVNNICSGIESTFVRRSIDTDSTVNIVDSNNVYHAQSGGATFKWYRSGGINQAACTAAGGTVTSPYLCELDTLEKYRALFVAMGEVDVETNSVIVDPLLANPQTGDFQWAGTPPSIAGDGNFALTTDSPAVDAGVAKTAWTTDIAGVSVAGTPDVGAYELGNLADLSVTIADSPDPVVSGQALTYSITVSNAGPSDAANVMLDNQLPSSVTLLSAVPTQGTCSGSPIVTCNLGTLGASATAGIVIDVLTAGSGQLTDTATVTGGVIDRNAANDSAAATTTVNAANGPDLVNTYFTAVQDAGNADKVLLNDKVTNQGNAPTGSGFLIRYYLSTDTTFEPASDIALAKNADGSGNCRRQRPDSLGVGKSDSSTTDKPCYKPSGAQSGVTYYVLVVNDADGEVAESNESNNVQAAASTISW